MEKGYKILGNYIRLVDERNRNLAITKLLGVSINKKFIPSIANIVGTDLSNYKIVRTGQFAYGPVTSRNGEKISIAYLDEEDCIISSSYTVFEVENKEELDPEYLMLWFSRPEFDRYARYKSHGSVREIFDWNELCMVELPVPDIEKQRKIVKAYKTLTDRIALKQQINENLEQQAHALFKAWFVDFEPFGGVMPYDWNVGIVSDLSKEIICGKTPSTKKKEYYGNFMPFITIPDMHNCVYAISTERYLSELGAKSQSKKTLPKNSICVSCIGTAGLVVLVAVDSQTNQQINSIIPKDGYSPYYIYLFMQTLSEKINRLGQSGSTIVNLNKAQFGIMEALVPSIVSMNEFDSIVQPLFKLILANQQENQRLSAIRDTLLPKLMNGEIDVSAVKI